MKIVSIFFLSLINLAGFGQTSLSFTQLSGDFTAPGRGAQHWGTTNWDGNSAPTIPAGNSSALNYYIRLNWRDVESSTVQGSYNWTILDNAINQAIDNGAMFTIALMPFCTACGTGFGDIPVYVQDLMTAEGKPGPVVGGNVTPNYQSTNWKARYSAWMRATANHLATTFRIGSGIPYRKAFLAYDIRHMGDFGEGVGYPSPSVIPSSAQVTTSYMMSMIDSARAMFPKVWLTIPMNYVAPDDNYSLSAGNPDAQSAHYALTATNTVGEIGWRRDNLGDDGYNSYLTGTTTSYLGIPLQPLIMNKWKKAPIGGEPAFGTTAVTRCGPPYCDMSNENNLFHNSYFGNGNYAYTSASGTPWTQLTTNMRAASAEMGYRIILDSGQMTTNISSGNAFNIKLSWHNIGIAPVYEPWRVTFELRKSSDGTVVWKGISRFGLKLFQPAVNGTLASDNFSMNNSIAAGTYTMFLIVRDTAGYMAPLPLGITGRQGDGSYPIRTGIVISSSPTTDSLTFINIQGESNAIGNAPNAGAPANELGSRTGVKIYNHDTHVFETLNIGGNNQQDGFELPNTHGLELAMANLVDSGRLPNPTYLVNNSMSGSFICRWNAATETACRPSGGLWTLQMPFVDGAITKMNLLAKPYRFYVWQSIGLNDEFGQLTKTDSFVNRMALFRASYRSRYSRPDIIFIGTNFNNPSASTLPAAWDSVYRIRMPKADPNYHEAPVLGATYMDDPASHFDYQGFKLIGRNIGDTMLNLQLTPNYVPPPCNTYFVGTPGGSVSITAMGSYNPCDIIKINTGTYTSLTLTHVHDLEFTSQDPNNPVTFTRLSTFSDFKRNVLHDFRWVSDLKSGSAWSMSGGQLARNEYYNLYWRDWPSSVITMHNNVMYDYINDTTAIGLYETYHDYIVDSCGSFMQGSFGDPNSGGTTAPDVWIGMHLYNFQDMGTSLQGGNGQGTGIRGICYECYAEDGFITDRSGRGADGDVGYFYGHGGWHLLRIHKWGGPGYLDRIFMMARRSHPFENWIMGSTKFLGTQYGFHQGQFNGGDTLTGLTYGPDTYAWSNTFGKQFNDTLGYWSSGFMIGQTCPGCHVYIGDNLLFDIGNNIQRVAAGGQPNNAKVQSVSNIGGYQNYSTDTNYHNIYAHDATLLKLDSTSFSYSNRTGTYFYYVPTALSPSTVLGFGVVNPVLPGLIFSDGHGYNSPIDLGAFQFQGTVPPLPPSLKPKRGLRIKLKSLP